MRVWLHGFTGSPASFDEVRAHVPGPALLPSLLGHGRPPAEGADGWNEEIDRLAAWLVDAGAHGSELVGYSLGARVGAGLLVRHPGLFRRAVLVGPNLGIDDALRAERRAWEERWQRVLLDEGLAAFVDAWEALPLFDSQLGLPSVERWQQQHDRRMGHTARGLARSLAVQGLSHMPDLRPAFASLSLPVRIVVGARDAKFLASTEPLASLPHVERCVVHGVGHNVAFEAPERLAELVRWT